ncbi:hypothetical protein NWE22_05305 [Streptococcus parasuis]|uniref:hypothetical protein n=1 Tax=Streptococcus parasuis TaxID=1501662 RepID=UPI00208395FC|nr:hypothetical protein [Streptococcus parasuis]MCQ8267348.1 hypothetical protein [Streptococcus suis]WFB91076.1 hypothetical protein NWE22_05305 [Streptococcus parasuis]BCP61778.1 hypothetical protein SUT380_09660 [Streptococcus parasuis]GIC30321.1 hypothetical protein SUT328_09800 [Streptococcus parasuis]
MAKITPKDFTKNLQEVTHQVTETIMKVSPKTGKEYQAEVIKKLRVNAVSSPTEKNGKYAYSIIDTKNDLEYSITAPNFVDAKFTTALEFTNVTGGLLNSGIVWFSSDSVAIIQRNA